MYFNLFPSFFSVKLEKAVFMNSIFNSIYLYEQFIFEDEPSKIPLETLGESLIVLSVRNTLANASLITLYGFAGSNPMQG